MKALLAIALMLVTSAVHAIVMVDDAGRSVRLERPAQRVVTLAPNLTEFVYAVGAGAALVGTVDTSDHPSEAKRIPRIGDYQRLDVERILTLRPDLILVWYHGNQGRELEQLEAAGLRLVYLEPRRLGDIARTLEQVGALLGHEAQGHAAAESARRDVAALRQRHVGAAPVSVFFQVWSQPLMTLNGQHLTSDLIALCGGRNVFAGLPALAPQVAVESVVAADPEVILATHEGGDEAPNWRREPQRASFATWHRFPRLAAVQRGWMITVAGDLVTRQGPRAVLGAKAVCDALDQVRAERAARRR